MMWSNYVSNRNRKTGNYTGDRIINSCNFLFLNKSLFVAMRGGQTLLLYQLPIPSFIFSPYARSIFYNSCCGCIYKPLQYWSFNELAGWNCSKLHMNMQRGKQFLFWLHVESTGSEGSARKLGILVQSVSWLWLQMLSRRMIVGDLSMRP